MATSVVSVICGLPGSGKTRLAHEILQCTRNLHHVTGEELDCPLNGINTYLISYDELIPIAGQKDIILMPGVWKEKRKDVICAAEAFISHIIGVPHSLLLSKSSIIFFEKLIQTNKRKDNYSRNAFLIDDNFYYQSMRHEWYLLAKKFSMGFCQIYLECPPKIASCRNKVRETSIPEEVIYLMAKKFEPPNQDKNPWEKNSVFVNVENVQECFLNKVLIFIEESLKMPLTSAVDDVLEKEQSKRICSTNAIHQIDIILRQLTGEKIKKKQDLCNDKKEIQMYPKKLNDARRGVLKALKSGELALSKNLLDTIENGNYNDELLQETLAVMLES